MNIYQAEFVISNSDVAKCPKPDRPEYAFIGRSNVGKSSLINLLTKRGDLAKTSGKPGKTQLINHFSINGGKQTPKGETAWYLVDLPGYGYAKVPKSVRDQFGGMITTYLTTRPNLRCIFVLIDMRIPPQKIDLDFMTRLGEEELPFVMVFTKAEKLKSGARSNALEAYHAAMHEIFDEFPTYFITSATTGEGRDDVLGYIEAVNAQP
jgi:GTP-binding protein